MDSFDEYALWHDSSDDANLHAYRRPRTLTINQLKPAHAINGAYSGAYDYRLTLKVPHNKLF